MSFKSDEAGYNRRRAADHAAKAKWSKSEQTRTIHAELSDQYSKLAETKAAHVISMDRPKSGRSS